MITAETGKTPETGKNGIGPLADFWIISASKLLEPIAHSIERAITLRGITPTLDGEKAEDRVVDRVIVAILNDSSVSGYEDPIKVLANIDYQIKDSVYDELYPTTSVRLYEGLTGRRNNIVDLARVIVFRVWDKLVLKLPNLLEILEVPQSAILENRSRYFSVLDNMFSWVLMYKETWERK